MREDVLRGICADRYAAAKIPARIDTIVVGSGMSGLSCAAVLSRMGHRVLVLEQHYVAGGGSHMFELKGGLRFDSGLHYLVPYSGLLLWLAAGGSKMPLHFERMGEPDGTFDRIALGDDPPFAIKHGEAHLPDLYARFPEHRADIDHYLDVSERILKRFPLFVMSKALPKWLQRPWHRYVLGETWRRYAGHTLQEVLQEITDEPRLAGLLAGPWMDTGAPPDRASFLMGACVARGLAIEGGAYPVGGSTELARELIPTITAGGGRVLVRAKVREIVVDPHTQRATGVAMEDGRFIACDHVVSSTGYHNTFGGLLSEDVTKRLDLPRRLPVGQSCGFVMANIGLRGSAAELGLTCANLWYHPTRPDGDMFGAIGDFMRDPQDAGHDPMIMVTFPSIKAGLSIEPRHSIEPRRSIEPRPSMEPRPSEPRRADHETTTCQLLCMAEYAWFEKYAGGRTRRRGEDYEALKEAWGKRLVEVLLRFYPQLADRIELVDISTPLSIEHYLGAHEGGAVGLDQTPQRFTDWEVVRHLDSRTAIEGLWLTGQDTLTCGQPIVQVSGLITALRMLGFWKALLFLAKASPPVVRHVIRGLRAPR